MLNGQRPVSGHSYGEFRYLRILRLKLIEQCLYPLKIFLYYRYIISIGSHTHKAYNLDTVRP